LVEKHDSIAEFGRNFGDYVKCAFDRVFDFVGVGERENSEGFVAVSNCVDFCFWDNCCPGYFLVNSWEK